MTRIYSPSQTAVWLQCRMKRALDQQGWQTREVGRRDLAAILSTAVHAGLAVYNRQRAGGVREYQAVHEATEHAALQALQALGEDGRHVAEYHVAQRDAIPARAIKAASRYTAFDPIPPEWPILCVETPCDESGARPDLVVDDGRGPCPVDYKVKLSLKPEYEAKEIAAWRGSWQLYHYAGSVCTPGQYHYYVCLIVCEPFRVHLLPFDIPDAVMQWWKESAARYYYEMEGEDAVWPPPMAAKHSDEYGVCEYWEACFGCGLDPVRMQRNYVQVARSR